MQDVPCMDAIELISDRFPWVCASEGGYKSCHNNGTEWGLLSEVFTLPHIIHMNSTGLHWTPLDSSAQSARCGSAKCFIHGTPFILFIYSNFDFFDSFYLILVSFIFSRSQTKSLNHFLRHTRSNEVVTATSSIDISNLKDSELKKRFCMLDFRLLLFYFICFTYNVFPEKLTLFPKAGQ